MVFFKLGLLTCAFYVGLTIVMEALIWAKIHFGGLGILVSGKHAGLKLGIMFGVVFGVVWLISFGAAWSIVYFDLKSKLSILAN